MTTEPTNATLFGKIAAVMGEVRTLEKTGRNQYDKYDYVTADAIAHRIGKVMASHKLALFPSMVSVETSEYTTQKGGANFRTVCHFQMTFACGDTGATWTSLWSGEAIDRSDKSISKAAVSAVKYFVLKTFMLSGGDEDDSDAESPAVEAPQPTQARNTTRTAPQPRPAPPVQPDVDMGMGDSNPFEDAAPAKRGTITENTRKRLFALGAEVYGKTWDVKRPTLVRHVTTGATESAADLLEEEAKKLCAGMEAKKAQMQQPDAQPEPVAA